MLELEVPNLPVDGSELTAAWSGWELPVDPNGELEPFVVVGLFDANDNGDVDDPHPDDGDLATGAAADSTFAFDDDGTTVVRLALRP